MSLDIQTQNQSGVTSLVCTKTIPLTNAQIKSLPTTPFELLPAPGAGKVIKVISGVVVLDNMAGVYTDVSPDPGSGSYLSYDNGASATNNAGLAMFYNVAQSIQGVTPTANITAGGLTEAYNALSQIENKPIVFSVYNDNGIDGTSIDFTGGHTDNTMKITVIYSIVDL